jgi:uncharacterized protein YjbJ (UPF0337 family)
MNKQILQGNWQQGKGLIKEFWGKLTDDEIEKTQGKYDQLVGTIQERYGYTLEQAQRNVGNLFETITKKIELKGKDDDHEL